MTEQSTLRSLSSPAGWVASALVIVGVLLWMFVSKGFLFVIGLGAFGPGLLREFGWLRDQDEFQRQAARRAGYHAFLVGGAAAVLIVSGLEWQDTSLEDAREWMRLIVLVLWMTWLFSALLAYWGARRTTAVVLLTFGSFWALFVLAHFVGEFALPDDPADIVQGLLGVLTGIAVVAPFFVLAWTAGRWPRGTGVILLIVSVCLAFLFAPRGNLKWSTQLLTATLLIVPLVATGLALLREHRSTTAEDAEPGSGNAAPSDAD